jgi:hypothetical protein
MTYKDNTPTFNVNRKVVNFKDFSANPNAEKEELKKMDRQNIPNSDEHQKNMANSRYKFNNTTRKMDDLSPAEIEDKIEAIEELEEGFDPMVGIDNFLNNPVMVSLATAWLLSGRYKIENLKSNMKAMKDDFLDYCNSMGYVIDKDILDFKFNQIIERIKKILKIN